MGSRIMARVRSLWHGVRRRSAVEVEMSEEFRLHVELRAADLVQSGLTPAEALRRARAEFGSTERYKEEGRASRGLHRIDALRFSGLDFKLGFRMLARYPGLTVVGGLAMAFAIWIGAATFELITQWVNPRIPLDDGDRIVGIQLWNTATQDNEPRTLHDFTAWREQVESIEQLSAFRRSERNLTVAEGQIAPVEVAEITASGFGLARVSAQLGRVLLEPDETAGAPAVIVIDYDLWQTRFNGDGDVVGRTVRLGNVPHTVIGVMPEDFGFPVSQDVWVPLKLNVLDYARGTGPAIRVVGRLATGVTLSAAQVELTTLGLRAAANFPETHEHLRPRVLPYARYISPVPNSEVIGLRWLNLFVVMLIVLVCGNVALLLFARAATREGEIVVRNALGASRGRIITQLFTEALVLAGVGAVVGIAAAGYGVRWGLFVLESNVGRLPFWFDDRLSRTTLLYAAGLTVLAALIAGVVPALRLTRHVGDRLRQATAGGGGLKFSGVWTVVIVAQVAVTVAFPTTAFFLHRAKQPIESFDVGFPSEEYLSVRLDLDADNPAGKPADSSRAEFLARFRSTYQELERQLSAEPAVAGVTFANRLPRMHHEERRIDVSADADVSPDSLMAQSVNTAFVDLDYFDVLGASILAGRGFHSTDVQPGHHVVIVNQSFVERVLRGRNPIGRHVRFMEFQESNEAPPQAGPWYEIVGVVKDLGMNYLGKTSGHGGAGLYQPLATRGPPLYMLVKVRGDPAAFAPRLEALAHAADPTLRLNDLNPMDELDAGVLKMIAIYIRTALLVSSIALLLSLAGIYAVMSFAVSRRTREIGIRVALGADAGRVMLAVFRRPLMQVGLGVIAGGWLVSMLARGFVGGLSMREVGLIIAYALLMMGVCMLACIVPVRRALGVEPTDALRADG